MSDSRVPRRELRWRLRQHLPLLVALVVLWMLLWGEISPMSVVSGIVVSVAVTRLFYLPPVELSGRFNPGWFLLFVVRFAAELFVGSLVVAWQALSPRRIATNAVVGVPLRTSSDFLMTMTATAVSLVPGSVVIEIDRDSSVLYLHVLGAAGEADIQRARATVLRTERGLVRSIGSRDDLKKVLS